jgi:phosphonate transport system substrate-binding protein
MWVGLLVLGMALGSLTAGFNAVSQQGLVPEELIVGMVPSRPATVLQPNVEGLAKLLVDYLQKNGFSQVKSVKAVIPASYPATIESLGTAKLHVGLLGPEQIVQVVDAFGSIPVNVTQRGETRRYRSQFMVYGLDSPFSNFGDLVQAVKEGKTVKFSYGGSSSSTSGFLFPCKVFKDNSILPGDNKSLKTIRAANHQASAVAVYKKDVDVGVGFEGVQSNLDTDSVKKELGWKEGDPLPSSRISIIGYSDWIPNDGIVVIKEIDQKLRETIQAGFTAIMKTPDGVKFGSAALNATAFPPVPADYATTTLKPVRVVVNEITPNLAKCENQ